MVVFALEKFRFYLINSEVIIFTDHAYPYGGHFGVEKTIAKVFQAGFYSPIMFKDARGFVMTCDWCQQIKNISNLNKASLK